MGLFDNLNQIFSPTPLAPPSMQGLTPPPAVKPAVVMVKPRLDPGASSTKPADDSGDDDNSVTPPKPRPRPQLGPLASVANAQESADPGRKKLFDNFSFGDVGAGINNVPAGLGPISSFAYGMGGAMQAKAGRKTAEAAAAAAKEQREFDNSLKTNADKRSQAEFDQKYTYTNKTGTLTPAGAKIVNDAVQEKAIELGLHTSALSADERKKANETLDAYRQSLTNDILNAGGVPDKLGNGGVATKQPKPNLRTPPDRGWVGAGQDAAGAFNDTVGGAAGAVGGAVENVGKAATAAVNGIVPAVGQAATAAVPAVGQAATAAVEGVKGAVGQAAGAVNDAVGGLGQPGGVIRGGGTHDDPKVGLSPSTSREEFDRAVPIGAYYVNPDTGKLMRRTK